MTKVGEKEIKYFIDEYLNGKSLYKISKETGFTPMTIKYWLIKSNVKLRVTKFNNKKKGKLDEFVILKEYVEDNISILNLSKKYNVSQESIKYYLYKNFIKIRENGNHKGEFTEEEKKEIIHLYVEEKRGAKYIGKLYNRSDTGITYWLNKWGIPKTDRKIISKKIREVYGATKGFGGKTHKDKSKKQISKSSKKSWDNKDRKPKIGSSRTYLTKHGKVLGSYEVAYLQKLIEKDEVLPNIVKKRYKTPYGTYMPDFEFNDRFIEIKSKFTYDVAKGIQPTKKGFFTDKQWKKINWLNENVKKVEVIIIEKEEGKKYFEKALNDGFILN